MPIECRESRIRERECIQLHLEAIQPLPCRGSGLANLTLQDEYTGLTTSKYHYQHCTCRSLLILQYPLHQLLHVLPLLLLQLITLRTSVFNLFALIDECVGFAAGDGRVCRSRVPASVKTLR